MAIFPQVYHALRQNVFQSGNYKLIPIRDEDKYLIMQWRNDQLAILRQKEPLTITQQENYFANVVSDLFLQEKPQQLLFSFLENDVLIGYVGLVHIDWESKSAEISFLSETSRNINNEIFINDWCTYLSLLKQIAKEQLQFTKIYTYAYDLRPHLYTALLLSGFIEVTRIKNHVRIDDKYCDVLIHTCFLNELVFRMATEADLYKYYEWANDAEVRSNSFSTEKITIENHSKWFLSKLESKECYFYLFLYKGEFAGQVRIYKSNNETVIGISIDKNYRGNSLSKQMLLEASNSYFLKHPTSTIVAYIKENNKASLSSFKKAGFANEELVIEQGYKCYKLYKEADE